MFSHNTLLRGRLLASVFVGFLVLLFPLAARAQNNQQIPILQVLQNQQSALASGSQLDFTDATVGAANGTTLALTVRNQGNAVLANLAVALTGADTDSFSADLSGTSVAPGSNDPVTLTLTFHPAASGIRSATVSLTSNDSARSPFLLELTGRGLQPPGAPTNVITFAALESRPYGSEAFDLSATASSGLPVTYSVRGPAVLGGADGKKLNITGAGNITITAAQRGGTLNGIRYPAARSVRQILVVTKVPLTLTVAPARTLRGAPLPTPSITYEGFVRGETSAKLATPPARSTPASTSSPAGTYEFTLSGGSDPNYTFNIIPSTLTVFDYSGSYEALLLTPDDDAFPAAKLELTVPATHAFTGKLADGAEGTLLAIKGLGQTFALDPASNDAVVTVSISARPVGRPAFTYTVQLRLSAAPAAAPVLSATLKLGETTLAQATDGRLVFTRNKTYTAQAATLVFAPPASLDPAPPNPLPLPTGYGFALGKFSPTGTLALKGTLADGNTFTASLSPDAAGRYRLFALPYNKQPRSYFAGRIEPIAQPSLPAGLRYVPANPDLTLVWAKSANTKEPAFRAGFGTAPLEIAFTLDPWLPPSKRTPVATLAQRLALPVSGNFLPRLPDPDFDLTGTNPRQLPTALRLTSNDRILVTAPAAASVAKSSFKFTPATGAFIGKATVSDTSGSRIVKRTVRIFGVLRQAPSTEEASPVFGYGQFGLTPLVKADETRFGEFRFERPAVIVNP